MTRHGSTGELAGRPAIGEDRLIIVRRDHKHLCEGLAGEHPGVEVILDRRHADTPATGAPPGAHAARA
jgi:hypothetical protein